MKRGQEDQTALAATQTAVATHDADFAALAARIGELRIPARGAPPLWARETLRWNDQELAAAILWHVIRARLWTQGDEYELPYLTTIGAALGADLVGLDTPDRDMPLKVGVQLLGIAESTEFLVRMPDVRGGHRITLADMPFKRLERLVNGAAKHVYTRVTATPPTGVEVQKPPEMRAPRPTPPSRIVAAADKVQGTAWHINRAVLDALEQAQTHGTTDEQLAKAIGGREYLTRRMVLAEARELATLERFYWPVFLEFRGRLFQESGALSYTSGDDYARGLLEFAEGEFVNEDGLKWLAWHMAQMWGEKELPFGDGTSWLRSAADILKQGRWPEAKHPAQFLAAALAVVDASEGRPVHLPVRVDATCSGMQHLALLLRDEEIGRLVNLWGDYHGDRRGMVWLETRHEPDFYARVGEAAGQQRSEAKCVIVPMLYGAGPTTLARKLAEERRGEKARVRQTDRLDAKAIVAAARQLAPGEFALLKWFGKVAKAHNDAGPLRRVRDMVKGAPVCWIEPGGAWVSPLRPAGLPVRWTTPSGLEAMQDYYYAEKDRDTLRRWPGRRVDLTYNGRRVNLVKRIYSDWLDKRQQVTSMPSSIVHSLDAALLTEIIAGSSIDRWAVAHDAFAVPPSRVWELLQANEDAMRALYAVDRLTEWVSAWHADGIDVPDPPAHDAALPPKMLGGLRTLG